MMDKDYKYFLENMPSLYKKYGHKFIVIKNRTVLGAYQTFKNALDETMRTETLGTFIIQECFKDRSQAIHHFQGNVTLVKSR